VLVAVVDQWKHLEQVLVLAVQAVAVQAARLMQ
jgi:hypothetical protein